MLTRIAGTTPLVYLTKHSVDDLDVQIEETAYQEIQQEWIGQASERK